MSDKTDIREVHGVKPLGLNGKRISVIENASTVVIDLGTHTSMEMNGEEARHLAQMLQRLARKIETRQTMGASA